MIRKQYLTKILWTTAIILCTYLLLCGLFIFQSSYTSYQCKDPNNRPESWKLPSRDTASTEEHPHGKFPFLEIDKWQFDNYKEVTFPSRSSNVKIHAWYTEVDKHRPVIIITHGIRPACKNNHEILLASAMLIQSGFNVVNIDLQNHGQSSKVSRFITYGQKEYLDILGAYDWLKEQGYTNNQIGLMGMSLGAVTSAIAFSEEPDIKAVWLDSPYSDFNTMFCYELKSKNLPCFFKYGVRLLAKIFIGTSPDTIKTTAAISTKNERHIFLTHGKKDKRIPFIHAEKFISTAQKKNVEIETWFIDDTKHLDAILTYPYLYKKYLTEFFNQSLVSIKKKA
ncbi:MAG: alpha/beta fold hydrolase [Pseudomonadota bacterium]|nr:alpha/beta fold hydrolase [Pseudomonadota bacterium]